MKKKITILPYLLAVILCFTLLAGCGKKQQIQQPDASEANVAASLNASGNEIAEIEAFETVLDSAILLSTEASSNTDVHQQESVSDNKEKDTPVEEVSDAHSGNSPGAENLSRENTKTAIDENGTYSSKDDVALYIHTYGKLPSNFITKKEAKALGWPGGGLDDYAPGKSIGGDKFGNYEGQLPEEKGRKYYECDIDTKGKSKRGAKRIIYSNDGLIFYTGDHYESFEQLY